MSRRITNTVCGVTLAAAVLLAIPNSSEAQVIVHQSYYSPYAPHAIIVNDPPYYYSPPAPVYVVHRPVYAVPVVTYAPRVTYYAAPAPLYFYRDPCCAPRVGKVKYKYEVDTPWGEYEYSYRSDRRGVRIREDWDR